MPLKIVGDDPMRQQVLDAIRDDRSIEWLGKRPAHEIAAILGHAAFAVIPSIVRETFGRVAIEAFATGTPVIAAHHGGPADIITDTTGKTFTLRDPDDLARAIEELLADPDRPRRLTPRLPRGVSPRITPANRITASSSPFTNARFVCAERMKKRTNRTLDWNLRT